MVFRGVDNAAFNEADPTRNYNFWGGVVELDCAALPNNRFVGSLMYNGSARRATTAPTASTAIQPSPDTISAAGRR